MTSSSQDHIGSDGSQHGDGINGSDSPPKGRSMTLVRGAALLKRIRRFSCEGTKKIPLKFNTFGKPIGEHSLLFENYVGYLARTQVFIAYTNWKAVPKQTKIGIYDALMNTFVIPPDRMDKKTILTNADNKWKTFKTNLGKLMRDKETGAYLTEPPKDYQYIDQDAWTEFVHHRSSKKFQELSNANRERSKQKMYPYRAPRMGYARLGEKMLIQQNLDPETGSIPRADLWKAARRDPDGKYADAETSRMANKIDMLKEQQTQGNVTFSETEDVLSLALEKDEHPGRLRGVGFGVGAKRYYGSTKQKCYSSQQEVITLRAQMVEMQQRMKVLEKCHKCMESQECSQKSQVPPSAQCDGFRSPIIDEESTKMDTPCIDALELPEQTRKCKLVWPNQSSEVAKGRAFIHVAGYTHILHGKPLEATVLKVTIDKILRKNAEVPYPSEEVPFLSDDTVGNIIAWPKDMVIFESVLT